MTGIYKITNKHNNKIYIGKSKDIMQRWSTHEKSLVKGTHHSEKLQNDFILYGGIEAFDFSVVEICAPSELNEKEKYYIEQYDSENNGYNGNEKIHNKERNEVVFTNKSFKELQNRVGNSYLMTYFYLRFNSDDNNQIILNQTQLADEFGLGSLTISKHIRVLIENGVVRPLGKSGLYNKYEILI